MIGRCRRCDRARNAAGRCPVCDPAGSRWTAPLLLLAVTAAAACATWWVLQ